MGCSNPHPHGQVWASDFLPTEPAREDAHQRLYFANYGRPLLLDLAERRLTLGERMVSVSTTSSPSCPIGQSGRSKRCCCGFW